MGQARWRAEDGTPYNEHPASFANLAEVSIWTDGSSSHGRPCNGGWAALLVHENGERVISGYEPPPTTNNRMELQAVLEGLFACTRPVRATIFTDSAYVANGWTAYLPTWVRRGWRRADGGPVASVDLWKAMIVCARVHSFRFEHVKGHAGNENNERVDQVAGEARKAGVAAALRTTPAVTEQARTLVYERLGVA